LKDICPIKIKQSNNQTNKQTNKQKRQMKTNVKIALLISMIFLSSNSFSQTNVTVSKINKTTQVTETHLGLVLNMVSTSLNYGKSNNAFSDYKKPVFGGQFGLSFQGGITPKFSVLTEAYVIMKGGKLEANNPLTANKTTLRFYTIELPALARFHFDKFYVNAGPAIAYNFYGTRKIDGASTEKLFTNSEESFKRWDASVQIGAGYRFKVRQKNVALDVRYSYGLTDIANGSHEMYNRYLNISLNIYNPWKSNPLARNKKS
jgi:hypothetical protein